LFSIEWIKKFWVWVFLIVALLFLMFSHQAESGRWNPFEKAAVEITAPFQRVFTNTVNATRSMWYRYFNLVNSHKQNLLLRDEIYSLKTENYLYKERLATYQRLDKLFQFSERAEKKTVAARVIGWDPSGLFKAVIIDKGWSSGLAVNMPVINAEGVVGRVISVSNNYSKVLLLIDQNSAVDCVTRRTRDSGIVKGLSAKTIVYEPSMDYVAKTSDIIAGDAVVTSGIGGVFPKGVPVGEVIDVKAPTDELFMEVRIKPSVDFSKLEEILVILMEDPLAKYITEKN
jgi:rod shape-determining protein MreC